ncbi:MAG: ABC transporter substrate-binding protein, partial [Burkholderiales bacterium]
RQPEYAQAMMGYLNAVGIKTKFQQLQYSALRGKIRSGKVPFAFMTWGSNSIGDISASTSAFFEGQPDDMARDPKVEALLKQADFTVDKTKRNAVYKQALQRIAQQAYWLPLFTYSINYAFSKDLDWTPTNDEVFRLFQAKWK